MVKYDENRKHAYFNEISFNRDEKTGYYLSSKKVKNNKRQRLHVYVWEYYNGEVPRGHEVHHKDEDKYNNEISNFELLVGLKHRRLHADEFMQDDKRLDKARANIKKKALPKAIEWHKSDAGIEWHKEHYKKYKDKFHKTEKYKCQNCGKEFETALGNNRFCSNNCKSVWRRKQGYDNVIKTCTICGKNFEGSKYAKTKTCSIECGRKQRIQTMQDKKNNSIRKVGRL